MSDRQGSVRFDPLCPRKMTMCSECVPFTDIPFMFYRRQEIRLFP